MIVIQKVAPLYLLAVRFGSILFVVGGLSALVGALGGLNQVHLRKLLAYSSISHLGWFFRGVEGGGRV